MVHLYTSGNSLNLLGFIFREHNDSRVDFKRLGELLGPSFPYLNFSVFQQADIRFADLGSPR